MQPAGDRLANSSIARVPGAGVRLARRAVWLLVLAEVALGVMVATAISLRPRPTSAGDVVSSAPSAAPRAPAREAQWGDASAPGVTVAGARGAAGAASSHTVEVIGSTLMYRDIDMETFGIGARHILVVGGIHGDEFGIPVAYDFSRYLRAHPGAVPSGTELDLVACANPDGEAARSRTNARGVDINRNFPSRNWSLKLNLDGSTPGPAPGSERETQTLMDLLDRQHYVRVVSLHSNGGLLDWDGPGGEELARRMNASSGVPLRQLPAYDGSMGSYVPERFHIPIVTWELSSPVMTSRVTRGLLASLR